MKKKKITGIIGLGYVGLPLMLEINKKNIVYGFEIDEDKINLLKNKISYISDISKKSLNKLNQENIFDLNDNLEKITECEYIIFCVPTPLKNKIPDMSFIKNSFKKIKIKIYNWKEFFFNLLA